MEEEEEKKLTHSLLKHGANVFQVFTTVGQKHILELNYSSDTKF